LNVSAGTLLPISIPNKRTDAAEANVTLTVNKKKYELGKLKQNSFHYIPFYNDSNVVVEAEKNFILGSPIRFKHSQNNKKNKKLVMSIFIDGLASEVVNEKHFDDLMPNTAKYFSEGSIFLIVYLQLNGHYRVFLLCFQVYIQLIIRCVIHMRN